MLTGLRSRLILLVLLAIIPAIGLALYTGLEQRKQTTINAEAEVLRLARLAATHQASLIEGGQQLLVALAQLPAVREGDRDACDAILASLLQQYAYYANLGVVKPNGDLLCSALPHNDPVSYADRDWLQEAVKANDFVIGQYLIGRLTGKAILPLAYPGLDEAGQVRYVVFAAIDLAWLNQIAAKAQLPEGSVYTLIDRQGIVLARHPDPQQWVGQALPEAPVIETVLASEGEGTTEAVGADGILRVFAFTPLDIEGNANQQYVTIGVPAGIVYAEVDRSLAVHLAGLGLVSLAAIIIAWEFSNAFIMRRINSLLMATQRLTKGDLSTRTQIPYQNNELSQLAQAFDGMAAALEGREAERRQAEERYRHLFETMMNGFALHEIITDENGKPCDYRFLDVNPAFEKITGLQAETVIGKTVRQAIPSIESYWIDTYGEVALSGTTRHFENYAHGLGKHFEVFAFSPRKGQFATLFLDITESKRAQDELLRVNRAVRTISECNQVLVRADDEAGLLGEICQTLVNVGGYRMAWVGYAEDDEAKTVRPVAHAGHEEGYLESLNITWADTERGQGPTGTAIRTGNVCKVNDTLSEPTFAPWRANAIQRGYLASIAVPLLNAGKAFGALNIYAEERDVFEEQEERLLRELADDLVYGILALRTRVARRQAEQALHTTEARLRAIIEQIPAVVYTEKDDGTQLYVSPQIEALSGYSDAEWLKNSSLWKDIIHPEDLPFALGEDENTRESGEPFQVEYRIQTKDGRTLWLRDEAILIRDEAGNPLLWQGFMFNITERKQAEKVQAATYRISQATVSSKSMDELYSSIHLILSELMPVENFYIALYEPATDLLRFPYFVDQFDLPTPSQKAGRGLTEYVLRSGRPLLASPQVFYELVQQGEVELVGTDSVDWLGVPLITEEGVIGVMVTQSYTEGIRYSQKDKDLLEFVSTQVALAIERKRAEEQIRQNAIRAQTLADISRVIVEASHDYQHILEVVVKSVSEVIGDACVITLSSEDGEWLHPVASYHPEAEARVILQNLLASNPVRLGEGTSGRVAQTGQPILISEAAPEQMSAVIKPEYQPYVEGYGVHSILIVPLRAQGQLIGTLGVTRDRAGEPYNDDDQSFLQEIGDRTALAITNARLYEQEQVRSRELDALNSLSTVLRKTLTTDEMLPIVLHEVRRLLHTDSAMIITRNQGNDHLKIALADGHIAPNTGQVFRSGEDISGIVFSSRQPFATDDYAEEPKRLPSLHHGEEIGPAVFVPLQSEIDMLGVLMAARHRNGSQQPFSPSDVRMLTTIGELVGNSLRRALLFEQTQRRLSRVQALRKIDVAITHAPDLQISINVILDQVMDQTGVDAACVLLFDSQNQTLKFAAGKGFCTDALQYTNLRLGEGYAGRAALEQRILNIPDLCHRKTDFLRSPAFSAEGFIAYYAIPLIAKGLVKGVLEIFHRAPLEPDQEWLDFLETLAGQAAIAIDNASLFEDLQRSNQELIKAYDATIEGWSRALDLRDRETEGHTQRVVKKTIHLAKAMGVKENELVHVTRGALLHDIGKMGIPDHILLKPGSLTEEEWALMRKHPVYAYEMLAPITYLKPALDIPYYHHEKWDGTGYPHGLRGEQIPLTARIFSVVDVWDALTSDRPYRKAWPHEKAISHIRDQAGSHFDPEVVIVFLEELTND